MGSLKDRFCRGNENEDTHHIIDVLKPGEAVKIEIEKRGYDNMPMAWKNGMLKPCEHFERGGYCRANPHRLGFCYRYTIR